MPKTDEEFEKEIQEKLVPMIKNSGMVVSFVPNKVDVKFAVELGISIMLDKPIIAVVAQGAKIPEKLARVVDRFVELDLNDPNFQSRLNEAVDGMVDAVEDIKKEENEQSD